MLVFSFVISLLTSSVFALNSESQMEAERTELHESIKAQLIEQDSLYLMDHFDSLIDDMLTMKYGAGTMLLADSYPYWYAPNGGRILGTGTYIEVEAHFFNVADTEKLYNSRNDPDYLSSLVKLIVGSLYTPFGVLLGLADLCNIFVSESQWKNINVGEEGCYVYAVYDTLELKTTKVVIGWEPPYMHLGSTITVTDHYVNPY